MTSLKAYCKPSSGNSECGNDEIKVNPFGLYAKQYVKEIKDEISYTLLYGDECFSTARTGMLVG